MNHRANSQSSEMSGTNQRSIFHPFICALLIVYTWIKTFFSYLIPPKAKSVANKLVLVTGGASGIGRLMSLDLASRGAKIVIWDINQSQLDATLNEIKQQQKLLRLPVQVWTYHVDVSDHQSVYSTAAKVLADTGCPSVDILINNAGVVSGLPLMSLSEKAIIRSLNINALAHFWTCKAFVPGMMERNEGHIVTIASMAGFNGAKNLTDYCASKFAAVGFHESLCYELACSGYNNIKFTLVAPFQIDTGMFAGAGLSLLPAIKPDIAAASIVKAILHNEEFITMPFFLRYLGFLKFTMPYSSLRYLNDMLGGSEFMDQFTGRKTGASVPLLDDNCNHNSLHVD